MMHLLHLENVPILEQLQIEEALLRADDRDWCIINTGAPPAIVMGISGKPNKLLHLDALKEDNIPLIKRYSGGGTVLINEETLFVTFIKNQQRTPFPKEIMQWSETFYRPLFNHPDFALRENDYVLGALKFGGNAQYIQKSRWVHHTSFLWDYDPALMHRYLRLPERRPSYRGDRSHATFLTPLRSHFPSKEGLIQNLLSHLGEVRLISPTTLFPLPNHRKSTKIIQS